MGQTQNPKGVIIIKLFRPEHAVWRDPHSVFVTRKSDIFNSSSEQKCQTDTPAVKTFRVELLLYRSRSFRNVALNHPPALAEGPVPAVNYKVQPQDYSRYWDHQPVSTVLKITFKFANWPDMSILL